MITMFDLSVLQFNEQRKAATDESVQWDTEGQVPSVSGQEHKTE